jgi:hypothetical protein
VISDKREKVSGMSEKIREKCADKKIFPVEKLRFCGIFTVIMILEQEQMK